MNLYNMLSVRALTAHDVARLSFNNHGVQPPKIAAPDVGQLFSRATVARGLVNGRADAMSYVLGSGSGNLNGLGSGLVGIGGLGEGEGSFPIFGPYTWDHACQQLYWGDRTQFESILAILGGQGSSGVNTQWQAPFNTLQSFFPPKQELVKAANDGYNYLQSEMANGNALAKARFETLNDETLRHIKVVHDITWGPHDWTRSCEDPQSRPWSVTFQMYQEMVALQQTMRKFADAPQDVPPVTAPGQQVDTSNLTIDALTRSHLTLASQQAKSGDFSTWGRPAPAPGPDPETSSDPLMAESALPSWVIPAGVGVGLLAVALVVFKKKKK